jgi:hypothetical protein
MAVDRLPLSRIGKLCCRRREANRRIIAGRFQIKDDLLPYFLTLNILW